MMSLSTLEQSSPTAVRLRPSLLLKHVVLNVVESGFGIGLVKFKFGWDKYAFDAAGASRASEFSGIAGIGIGRRKAAFRNTPKSSIAATPSLQPTQVYRTW